MYSGQKKVESVFWVVSEVVCFWSLSRKAMNLLMELDYLDPSRDLRNAFEYALWTPEAFGTGEGGMQENVPGNATCIPRAFQDER